MSYKTVNRMREVPLKPSPVLRGITQTSRFQVLHLHAEMRLNIPKQCPGVILKKITKRSKCVIIVLPNPLRKKGIENIEERGVREREKIEMNLLFMMRARPISAH